MSNYGYGPEALKVLNDTKKVVLKEFPNAVIIETGIKPGGENNYIIYRPMKGIIGVLLGKGASPIAAWSNVKWIIDNNGPDWYFKRGIMCL